MSENSARLCKWHIITNKGQYVVSEAEKDSILKADMANARFVQIDGAVINIAFIQEIYRKYETVNLQFSKLAERDRKYLVKTDTKQITNGKKGNSVR